MTNRRPRRCALRRYVSCIASALALGCAASTTPTTPMLSEQQRLDYFHQRSGRFVDFFCVGYGAYWPPSHWPPGTKVVSKLGHTSWLFSPRHFNQARDEIEQQSKWSYSGETDLILTVARKAANQPATVDLGNAIACNLEQMIRDQAISSMRAFFEQIFRFGEKYTGEDPVTSLSDKLGVKAGSTFLLEAVLTLVPESARNLYKSARHFAIRDISKA